MSIDLTDPQALDELRQFFESESVYDEHASTARSSLFAAGAALARAEAERLRAPTEDRCAFVHTQFPLLDPKPKVCGLPRSDDIHDPLTMKLGAHDFAPSNEAERLRAPKPDVASLITRCEAFADECERQNTPYTDRHRRGVELANDCAAALRALAGGAARPAEPPEGWERRGGAWRCEGCGAWLTDREGASGDHGIDDGHGNELQCGPVTFWSAARPVDWEALRDELFDLLVDTKGEPYGERADRAVEGVRRHIGGEPK